MISYASTHLTLNFRVVVTGAAVVALVIKHITRPIGAVLEGTVAFPLAS